MAVVDEWWVIGGQIDVPVAKKDLAPMRPYLAQIG